MAEQTPKSDGRPRRSGGGARPVGAFLPRVAKKVFAAHGFPTGTILSDWPALAGSDLASFTAPERLIWPRRSREAGLEDQVSEPNDSRRPDGATLVLRVDGPRAIEVQHCTSQIIERINTQFGYRAVAAIRIVQGPVAREQAGSSAPANEAVPDEEGLDHIADDDLRTALARLRAGLK